MLPTISTPALAAETAGHQQQWPQWKGQDKENAESPYFRGQVRVVCGHALEEGIREGVNPLATLEGIGKVTDGRYPGEVCCNTVPGRLTQSRAESENDLVPRLPVNIASLHKPCNE